MFKKSRSKRANQNAALHQTPPTAAAAIAALQATGVQNVQDSRLAAGAAAAALRSHTASPVPVGEIQTRRMVRRASITSDMSQTSYQAGRLSRSGSISSMTSRTFRSPSPHGMRPGADALPPVPPIPRAGATSPSIMTTRTFRRPASTEPQARMMSPTPQAGQRNMSVDTAIRRKPASIRTSGLVNGPDKLNGNRNSVNFSRPMSPENRPLSPSPTSPIVRDRGGYASPLSQYEQDALEYKYQELANKPVKKKKGLGGDEGSHLAMGTMGRARGTAVDPSPIPTTRPKRMPLPRRISEESEEEEWEEVYDPHTRTFIKRRKQGPKAKRSTQPAKISSSIASSPVRQPVPSAVRGSSPAESPVRVNTSSVATTASRPAQDRIREASVSPAAKTRFSLRPDDSQVHHEPVRSLTPTKSALRKSPSPRGPSPADTNSNRASWNQPGFSPSEASDSNSHLSDDRPKRKSVRVSFDDRPTIVGTSAATQIGADSPLNASPQNEKKKHWFGLRKNKVAQDEKDEGMAPTPTLPSFGSVRGRRPTEEQEPIRSILGIPGVAVTTGEQTPSDSGSHLDESEMESKHNLGNVKEDGNEHQVNGNAKLQGGDVPMIAITPGTPGVEGNVEDPLATSEADVSPAVSKESSATSKITGSEPGGAATAHDLSSPMAEHVDETTQRQDPEAAEKLETDSQDSHYSDANEQAGGGGFGSINAIVESPIPSPDLVKKTMAESLPPFTESPPPETKPVAVNEADSNEQVASPSGADRSGSQDSADKTDVKRKEQDMGAKAVENRPTLRREKSPLESITYNPRRLGSTSSSRDVSPDGPRRFTKTTSPQRSQLNERNSPETRAEEDGLLAQSGPYPVFERSPRQSFHEERGDSRSPPTTSPTNQESQKQASVRDTKAASSSGGAADAPVRVASEKRPLKSALKQTNRMSMPPERVPEAVPRTNAQRKSRPVSSATAPATSKPSDAVLLAQAMIKVQENRAKEAKAREADLQASLQRARASSLGAGSAPAPKQDTFVPPMPKIRRRGSAGSDSSFKRGPPSVTSEGGRVSMRRSMRAAPPSRPQSMVAAEPVRSTIRTNPNSRPTSMAGGGMGSRTMRSSREPSPTRSMLSFKKPSRVTSVRGSGPGKTTMSRFADDSDDDDYPASISTSRFEERRAKMRPARSVPQVTEEIDSSDLDSDAGTNMPGLGKTSTNDDRLMELARRRLGIEARPEVPNIPEDTRYNQGDLAAAFAETKAKESKRRSIFGTLSRRRNQSKISKDNVEDSIARKDTPLERTVLQRRDIGQESQTSTPVRPRFSRQNTGERVAALKDQVDPTSWPLPESPSVEKRPETSDGSPPNTILGRPMPTRQTSADSAPVYGRNGKKKRFPKLRRAFGLHD